MTIPEKNIIFVILFISFLISLYQIKSDVLGIDLIPKYHSPDLVWQRTKGLLDIHDDRH